MFQYKCLNPISACGTSLFTEEYKQVEELQEADAVLVRSAAMHDMQDVPNLLAVARAGAGVNNIPIADYSDKGIVVFNTPGANANGVKEMGSIKFVRVILVPHCTINPPKNSPKQMYPFVSIRYFTPDAVSTILRSCPNHEFVSSAVMAVMAVVRVSFLMMSSARSEIFSNSLNRFS